MTRALALQSAIAAIAAALGLSLLLRPARFGVRTDPARYAARIAGMMLTALGLFLGGFATIFWLAGAA